MAEEKKSFLLYADLLHTVEQMPDDKAGILLKTILFYVNDQNPDITDLLVRIAFEPVKQQLKRDLNKWEDTKLKKVEGGQIGNLKRWHTDLYKQFIAKKISLEEAVKIARNRMLSDTDADLSHTDRIPIENIAPVAVNVNDTVNVSVNDTVNVSVIDSKKESVKKKEASPSPSKKIRTLEDFKEMARLSFENNACTFSNNFKIEWLKLLQEVKWKNKSQSAIDASLKLLAGYDEAFATALVIKAIAGNYQGVSFADTDNHYLKYQTQSNGNSKNLTTADKTISRNNMVQLARSILSDNPTEASY